MITEEMIPDIEKAFGFTLYDWQKDYILGKTNTRMGGRRNGNTFAYCIKLLLSDGKPITIMDLNKYVDELHGNRYDIWFVGYIKDINEKLVEAGFKTRMIKQNRKSDIIKGFA